MLLPYLPTSPFPTYPIFVLQELLDTLRAAEAKENTDHAHRRRVREAQLSAAGRDSAIHFRHSGVLDWSTPVAEVPFAAPSGGRQHPEARRHALEFQRLRDRVAKIQDDRDSAGPVSKKRC